MSRYSTVKRVKDRKITRIGTANLPDYEEKNSDVLLIATEGDRCDTLAFQYYGNPEFWWFIASVNKLSTNKIQKSEVILNESILKYFFVSNRIDNLPNDPVARFHIGNGAILERINFLSDTSEKGLEQSLGFMVNYLYILEEVEINLENYVVSTGGGIVINDINRKFLRDHRVYYLNNSAEILYERAAKKRKQRP